MDEHHVLVSGEIVQLLRFTRSPKLTMSASDLEDEEQLGYRYNLLEHGYVKFVESVSTKKVNLNHKLTLTDKGRAVIMTLNPGDYSSHDNQTWPLERDVRRAQRRVITTK